MLIEMAKKHGVYIIGGSIPERDGDVLYNTCVIVNPFGGIIGKHRKVHLFDIDIPGEFTFKESDTLNPGSDYTMFDTHFGCKIGVAICYDIRFQEMSSVMRQEGCDFLVFPASFSMKTGPAHFELLQRARAVDNQVYVSAVSPARNPETSYQSWGHSAVVDPWGTVIAGADEKETILYADINLDRIKSVRQNIPISYQRREDLYTQSNRVTPDQ
eukprot:TRINITY_DN3663_c0_g1_i2.p1 TRINITY_DN3663_c0_g1~~TRINITY_DN3663_c0_g1_i2.p1  ORF type:complete len:214 (-),score=57.82 TRINITY_DN3663_c0_g1_i2:89-730(-)